jgi:hypothetical protein
MEKIVWKKYLSNQVFKLYRYKNIIEITFTKSTKVNYSQPLIWILQVKGWDIPNYDFLIYERFNENKFLEIANKVILNDNNAHHCILNRIFRSKHLQ